MQGPQIIAVFCPLQHFLGGYHLVLFLADGTQHVFCREGLVIQAHVLDDFLHDPLRIGGIINGKASGIAHPLNVPPQNPAACRVEGHGPDILSLRAQQRAQTLLQLIGGFVGKGNGDDAPG